MFNVYYSVLFQTLFFRHFSTWSSCVHLRKVLGATFNAFAASLADLSPVAHSFLINA